MEYFTKTAAVLQGDQVANFHQSSEALLKLKYAPIVSVKIERLFSYLNVFLVLNASVSQLNIWNEYWLSCGNKIAMPDMLKSLHIYTQFFIQFYFFQCTIYYSNSLSFLLKKILDLHYKKNAFL